MKKSLRDANLVVAAKTNESVFEQLLPEFRDLVWFCYWRIFGGSKKLYGTCLTDEDVFQEGMYGLLKALKRYDPKYGTEFATFAVPYISGEMLRRFRDMRFAFHVSRSMYDAMPDNSASDDVKMLKTSYLRSLDEIVYDDGKGGGLTLADIISSEEWEDLAISRLVLEKRLSKLSARDAKIVKLRMAGFGQMEIAKRVGVSQACVSRVLAKVRRFHVA